MFRPGFVALFVYAVASQAIVGQFNSIKCVQYYTYVYGSLSIYYYCYCPVHLRFPPDGASYK